VNERKAAIWSRLWLLWATFGFASGFALLLVERLWHPGREVPAAVWWWWLGIGTAIGLTLEVWALARRRPGDTLSEQIWKFERGARSLVVFFCAGTAAALVVGVWPTYGVTAFGWMAYHFAFDGPPRLER
jgi:hypothetical protein